MLLSTGSRPGVTRLLQEQIQAGDGSPASGQVDLGRVARIVRRRLWAVALTTAVVAASAWALAGAFDQGYVVTTRVSLSTTSKADADSDLWRIADARVESVALLVGTPMVAAAVIEDVDLGWTTSEVVDHLSARAIEDTVIVEIEARHPDPAMARAIVEAASSQLPALVSEVIDPRISVRLVGPTDQPSRASPSRAMAAALGVVVGPFLGVGVALVLHRLRRRIRNIDDIPADLRPLGHLSLRARGSRNETAITSHLVRMRLDATTDRPSVITVAEAGSAPAVRPSRYATSWFVAAELARAYERAGRTAVVVDGNFGSPGPVWPSGPSTGLSDVLRGRTAAVDALTRIGDLTVLPRGLKLPGPTELHSTLAAAICQLVKAGLVVIIDAPPALDGVASVMAGVSDATVIVARAGRTSRDTLRVSVEALAVPLRRVGVVVAKTNGSTYVGEPAAQG